MGLIDRFAKALAAQIEKAPNLPAGTTVQTEQQVLNNANFTSAVAKPLGRPENWFRVPFGPGRPVEPGAINPVDPETGRPAPRRYEYQVAQNINITETRLIPFKTLRAAADQIDILRLCVEVAKSKMMKDFDIVLSQSASEKIIAESGGDHLEAMDKARKQFAPEIARLREFWEVPDKQNGLLFNDWLKMLLEDLLVLDAVAIWGQKNLNGDLYGFQLLDGSTIKPLLDERGMRPLPPAPAFQQILFGFPRSEFLATSDDAKVDGEFSSDELVYLVRNRRTNSVYGYGPVEQALPLADIYLRYQQWIRAEYTNGVTPSIFFTSDMEFGDNPELILQYEKILNDDLAGQTEARQGGKLLPAGIKPEQMAGYAEKFNATFIDTIVTRITGFFGVTPSEVGVTPKSGLGGAGHEKGQNFNSQELGLAPLETWIERQLSQLSYTFLGMPRELEVKLMNESPRNSLDETKAVDIALKDGQTTINEARALKGQPLLENSYADMPMIVAGTSLYFLTADGVELAGAPETPAEVPGEAPVDGAPIPPKPEDVKPEEVKPEAKPEEVKPTEPKPEDKNKSAQDEIKTFIRWVRKGNSSRAFNFEAVEPTYAEVLNKFVEAKDLDGARWYAERYLGL